jgi:hypothetical protein
MGVIEPSGFVRGSLSLSVTRSGSKKRAVPVDVRIYLPEIGVAWFPGVLAMDRAEAWATFVLVLVAGLVLLSLMGVLVGAWVDHAFNGLIHTLGSPLVLLGSLL